MVALEAAQSPLTSVRLFGSVHGDALGYPPTLCIAEPGGQGCAGSYLENSRLSELELLHVKASLSLSGGAAFITLLMVTSLNNGT